MDRETLIALAERVEKAEGLGANWRGWEGWDLQREVAYAVGWTSKDDGRGDKIWTDHKGQFAQSPMFLCSLDAAMTLCPQPPSFDLDHDHMIQGGKWNCLVGDDEGWVPNGRASAATPALALTAACLRAHAEGTPNVE